MVCPAEGRREGVEGGEWGGKGAVKQRPWQQDCASPRREVRSEPWWVREHHPSRPFKGSDPDSGRRLAPELPYADGPGVGLEARAPAGRVASSVPA